MHNIRVTVNGIDRGVLAKRHAALAIITALCEAGVDPTQLRQVLPDRWKIWIARDTDKHAALIDAAQATPQPDHKHSFDPARHYLRESEVIVRGTTTYIVSNQWGESFDDVIATLQEAYPQHQIGVQYVSHV